MTIAYRSNNLQMVSPTTVNNTREYVEELKQDFIGLVCGQDDFEPVKVQQEILRRIKYVYEAGEQGIIDKDIADFILRMLAADLVGIKLSDILERWHSRECKHSVIRQCVLPGME